MDQILICTEETDKERLLARMVGALLSPRLRRLNPGLDEATLREAVLGREAERPTVMGNALAFPHARVKGFHGIGIALAILRTPINFGGDAADVRVVCMIVVPQEAPMVTLKVMSRMAQFFRDTRNRDALLAADSSAAVNALLVDRKSVV